RRAMARARDLDRMRADADRDRQRTPALVGPLREQSHVVRCDDVDAGEALFLHDEAVDAAVDAELGVARDHHAGGDHGTAVKDRGHGDRQLVEVDPSPTTTTSCAGEVLRYFGGIGWLMACVSLSSISR